MGMTTSSLNPVSDKEMVDSTSERRTVNNNKMRHQYRVLSDSEKQMMTRIKDKGLELDNLLDTMIQTSEVTIARQKNEETVMWAIKALTR